ncbi:hypothetical protein QL285_077848 [Trifolium repens]|nr:hypothetical protein QL285_077848 [Trifolium repens]
MLPQEHNDLLKVMNWIKNLKIELTCKESSPVIIEEERSVQEYVTKILDPIVAQRKGRRPAKRKASKLDQIVKKKLAGKKTRNSSKKSNSVQTQEEVPYYPQSQIIKHNISYAELLEAQHHMNDKPSS